IKPALETRTSKLFLHRALLYVDAAHRIADHNCRASAVNRAFQLSRGRALHGQGKIGRDSARVAAAVSIDVGPDIGRQLDSNAAADGLKGDVTLRLSGDFDADRAARSLGLHRIAGFDVNASTRGVRRDLTAHFVDADAAARGACFHGAIHLAAV